MEKLLDSHIVDQVREVFGHLKEPVQILYFGSETDCETCDDTRQLLEEVAAIDDRIGLTVHDGSADDLRKQYGVDKSPMLVIAGLDGDRVIDQGIRFAGVPAGHEFNTLINDIVLVSRRDSGLSQETRDFLKGLDKPLLLQVFVTPT